MNGSYRLYPVKRNALSAMGDAKMLAEDAAIQHHPSFLNLQERWYYLGVLPRAAHMGQLASTFKKVAIARNLQKDEGTVRLYAAIAKLSSYWKRHIEDGESYARVLKAAKSDPRPDIKPESQVPAAATAGQPAKDIAQTPVTAPPPAADAKGSPLTLPEPAAPAPPCQDKVPVQTATVVSRARERQIPDTGPNQHSQTKPHNGRDPKHCHECLKRERKRQRLQQKRDFYHPQSSARISVERELAELSGGE